MIEEKIEIRTADGTPEGLLYRPEAGSRYPGVIHLTDIGGIRRAHQDMARRLAAEGYAVLMPSVFYRTGNPPLFDPLAKAGDERMKRFAELSAPLTPEAIVRDVAAYVDFLAAHDSVTPSAMGVVGYCFTGKIALLTAKARPDKIAAVASFHGGGLATDAPDSLASCPSCPSPSGHQSAALLRSRYQRPQHARRSNRETRPGSSGLGWPIRR